MILELKEREKDILKRLMRSCATDIRTVRLRTDSYKDRQELKEEEEAIREIIENLEKSEEFVMDVQDFCKNVREELSVWMEKIEGVSENEEAAGDKLQTILNELGNRIDELKNECSNSWKHEGMAQVN